MAEVGIEVEYFGKEIEEGLGEVAGIQGNDQGKSVGTKAVEVDKGSFE